MKRLLVLALFLVAAPLLAEENSPAPATTPVALASPKPGGEQATTTQIYGDEASFDTEKRIGIFTGHVRVFDPRFNIQSDKLTVYIHKEESQGLERAIAEGHVGVVRDKPADAKNSKPSKAVGLSDKAVYTSLDGNVVLTGSPRVQQGLDTHIATAPETVMILNQEGHLTTHGPSRTEIRQENTPSPAPGGAAPTATPRVKEPKQERAVFPRAPKKP